MLVLGIESSCDETGLGLYDPELGLLGHTLYSQTRIHAPYGGVVPELASRNHIEKITPLLETLLQETQTAYQDITAIAYTKGPGLVGALLVGATFAKTLAFSLNITAIGIHHLEGHLLAPFLETNTPQFPFTALLVSGGHTSIIEAAALGQYHLLGETLDDAVGEAFDKTAKLLGLGYPGGPLLEKLALKGIPGQFTFPRPLLDRPGCDFSFSGLKTAVAQTIHKIASPTEQVKADIALAFQTAVSETLATKCKRAMQQTNHQQLLISGGVSANQVIREKLLRLGNQQGFEVIFPKLEFCTDNGAMIAYAGYHRFKSRHQDTSLAIEPIARWPLGDVKI